MTTAPLTIIVDTREPDPAPWSFPGCEVVRRCLRTGDYSLPGCADPPFGIAIERKTGPDLVRCMSFDRERFERELVRMSEYRFAVVVVECELSELLDPERFGGMTSASRLGSVLAWQQRYPTVHWLFCPGARWAERIARRILERYVVEHEAAGAELAAVGDAKGGPDA